jgi:hypothetical protein
VVQLFTVPSPPDIAAGWFLTERLLAAMKDTSRTMGSQMAVVLLPLRYQLSDTTFAGFVRSAGMPPERMGMYQPQTMIRRMTDSLRVPVVDLLPAFRQATAASTAPLYVDWDGHWNDAGHRLAASVVVQALIAANLVPRLR